MKGRGIHHPQLRNKSSPLRIERDSAIFFPDPSMNTIGNTIQTPVIQSVLRDGTRCVCRQSPVDVKARSFRPQDGILGRTMCIRSEPFLRVTEGNGRGQMDNGAMCKKLHIPFVYCILTDEN